MDRDLDRALVRHFMLGRRRVLLASAVVLLEPSRGWARVQDAGRLHRVVFRFPWGQKAEERWHIGDEVVGGVSAALARLGFREGAQVAFSRQFATPDKAVLARQIEMIRSLPADVVVVAFAKNALRLNELMPEIPIVVWAVHDPVARGLADSFVRPGRNVTGVTQGMKEVSMKQVEILRQLVPRLSGIVVFSRYKTGHEPEYLTELRYSEEAIRMAGLESRIVRSMAEAGLRALATMRREGYQAAICSERPGEPASDEATFEYAEAAIRGGVALMGGYDYLADQGFLAAYSEQPREFHFRLAQQLAKILRGGRASELPYIAPSRFYLRVNLRTADALGLDVPPAVRILADQLVG